MKQSKKTYKIVERTMFKNSNHDYGTSAQILLKTWYGWREPDDRFLRRDFTSYGEAKEYLIRWRKNADYMVIDGYKITFYYDQEILTPEKD